MKKTKKKFLIVFLTVLLLGLAVGYAAFADVLNISGTANLRGEFNMIFLECLADSSVSIGYTETVADADKISDDGKTLTIGTRLGYPGAGVKYDVVISNEGSIPARINADEPLTITSGGSTLSGNAVIRVQGLAAPGQHTAVINPGSTCEFSFTIDWPSDKTDPDEIEANDTYEYQFAINYVQATEEFSGQPIHDDSLGG